ncbi:hypothetical protein ACLMJK_006550 [Lecanora helva]
MDSRQFQRPTLKSLASSRVSFRPEVNQERQFPPPTLTQETAITTHSATVPATLKNNLGSQGLSICGIQMSLSAPLRRTSLPSSAVPQIQRRHATLLRRPKRPYTFTQLVTLSDGSTYTHRTTSPQPIYRSAKDTRNTPLWNPSSQKLLNMETDEAGKLRAFREKFGRGWDATRNLDKETDEEGGEEGDGQIKGSRQEEDNLMDLISGYGQEAERKGDAAGVREGKERSGKGKGGER